MAEANGNREDNRSSGESEDEKEKISSKSNDDISKSTVADWHRDSEVQQYQKLEDNLGRRFSYKMDEEMEEDLIRFRSGWVAISDALAESRIETETNVFTDTDEEKTVVDNRTGWKKDNVIPLKYDELPPEADWAPVSDVVLQKKGKVKKSATGHLNPHAEMQTETNITDTDEEKTAIDKRRDWKKDNIIPLKYDELPPEADWAPVSDVVLQEKKQVKKSSTGRTKTHTEMDLTTVKQMMKRGTCDDDKAVDYKLSSYTITEQEKAVLNTGNQSGSVAMLVKAWSSNIEMPENLNSNRYARRKSLPAVSSHMKEETLVTQSTNAPKGRRTSLIPNIEIISNRLHDLKTRDNKVLITTKKENTLKEEAEGELNSYTSKEPRDPLRRQRDPSPDYY